MSIPACSKCIAQVWRLCLSRHSHYLPFRTKSVSLPHRAGFMGANLPIEPDPAVRYSTGNRGITPCGRPQNHRRCWRRRHEPPGSFRSRFKYSATLALVSVDSFATPTIITRRHPKTRKKFFEFFTVPIRNPNTRSAYYRAIQQFLAWAERAGYQDLEDIEPITVAAYIEILQRRVAPPTVKQHMAAIRMMFSWLTEKGSWPSIRLGRSKPQNSQGPKARRRRSAPRKFKKSSLPSIRAMSSAIGTKHFLLRWLIRLPGSEQS